MRRLVAVVVAMAATTLVAALARTAGVDLVVAEGEEAIPLSGIAFVTGVFSVAGVVIAVGLQRWSAQPARRFLQTSTALTAISLVAPILSAADGATTVTLIGLHLVAAAVMIPVLTWSLSRAGADDPAVRPAPSRP